MAELSLDDELAQLQEELFRVQQASAAHKLSSRNCVELVTKLIDLGKLDVYFTFSQEYLTPAQLDKEIKAELRACGGRTNIRELQAIINIDSGYIASHVNALAADNPSIHVLAAGEVVTETYLDTIADDVNVELQRRGQMTIGDVATTYQLPVPLCESALKQRLGLSIQAELKDRTLYTAAYTERERARVRGAFNGITRPSSITTIVNALGLDDSISADVVRQFIAAGKLAGTVRGDTYVPHVFAASQRRAAEAFFRTNRYLGHRRAQELQLGDAKAFLSVSFPGCIALPSCVVDRSVADGILASVEECIFSKTFVDLDVGLQFPHTDEDTDALLAQSPKVGGEWVHGVCRKAAVDAPNQCARVADRFLVSHALLDAICDRFHATQQRAADFQRRSANQAASSGDHHGAGAGASDSSDADGFVMVDSAGTGAGAGAGAGRAASQPSVSHADAAAAKAALEPMSTDGIADTIRQWYEDDELAAYPELVDAIAATVHNTVEVLRKAAKAEAMQGALRGDARAAKRRAEELQSEIEKIYNTLVLHASAVDAFRAAVAKTSSDPAPVAYLQSYLMKTEAAALADRFLLTQCRVYDVPVPEGFAVDSASVNDRKSLARAILESVGGAPAAAPAPAPSSNAKRGKKPRGGRGGGKKKRRGADDEEDDDVDAADASPATPEQALVAMVDACTARTEVSEFKDKFEAALSLSRVRINKNDRKASRAALRQMWLETTQRLRLASSGKQVLLLTLLSLWQEMSGTSLLVPDDWWGTGALLVTLKPWMSDDAFATVAEFSIAVEAYSGESSPPTAPALSRQESAESITNGTDDVRSLGLAPKTAKAARK